MMMRSTGARSRIDDTDSWRRKANARIDADAWPEHARQ